MQDSSTKFAECVILKQNPSHEELVCLAVSKILSLDEEQLQIVTERIKHVLVI
nr:MAG TPA_asm: hypothetical protein [Caudoviricetes sp.]